MTGGGTLGSSVAGGRKMRSAPPSGPLEKVRRCQSENNELRENAVRDEKRWRIFSHFLINFRRVFKKPRDTGNPPDENSPASQEIMSVQLFRPL